MNPSQECHLRHSAFKEEANEVGLYLVLLALLELNIPSFKSLMKTDVEWLSPFSSEDKKRAEQYLEKVKMDCFADWSEAAAVVLGRVLLFFSKWPNFFEKDLNPMLKNYEQMLYKIDWLIPKESFSKHFDDLEECNRGDRQDEVTRACGKPKRRNAKDSDFSVWDFYMMQGLKPMQIVRELYPNLHRREDKRKALMRVRRRLERCEKMIYGQAITQEKKMLRLSSFNPSEHHWITCPKCKSAKKPSDCCQLMQEYLNQEWHYERERQMARVKFEDKDEEIYIDPKDTNFDENELIEKIDRNLRKERNLRRRKNKILAH